MSIHDTIGGDCVGFLNVIVPFTNQLWLTWWFSLLFFRMTKMRASLLIPQVGDGTLFDSNW